MKKIVVLGSINVDHVIQVDHFVRPGETLSGHRYQTIFGGKGANQAVACARLGTDISLIAALGDDGFGRQILSSLSRDGVSIDCVSIQHNVPTGIAFIQVTPEGQNAICISPEANGYLKQEAVQQYKSLLDEAHYLMVQLETPIEGIVEACKIVHQHGGTVILDPAPATGFTSELLPFIDIITPNETEAETITGIVVNDIKSAACAAEKLHALGVSTVIITLGAKGVWFSEHSHGQLLPARAVGVVDTTAAGDTFNGAMVTALSKGMSLEQAIDFAQIAASISVGKHGAQSSIPFLDEVDAVIKTLP